MTNDATPSFLLHSAARDPWAHAALTENLSDSASTNTGEQIRSEAELAMERQIEAIGQQVPEMNERKDEIVRGGTELIRVFGVQPEFFEDNARSTIFLSLALSTTEITDAVARGDGNRAKLFDKQAFVANATFLLTRNYADAYPELREQYKKEIAEGKDDDGPIKPKLDKYVQPEVTRALNEYVAREGIFAKVREAMGMPADEPGTPVGLHALSVGNSGAGSIDLTASGLNWLDFKDWDMGLMARTQQFIQEVPGGELASQASGFAVSSDGQKHIYVPAASAEIMMAEERGIPLTDYAQRWGTPRRVIRTVAHEYVHTQGSVLVEDQFGKSLEERRAEYYSGDGGEYFEVKKLFRQLQVLYGIGIGDMFDETARVRREEGQDISIYAAMANHYGLDKVAEIAAAQPDAYVRFARSGFVHDMLAPLGGFSGMIERAAQDPRVDKAAAVGRLHTLINNLRSTNRGGIDPDYEAFLGSFFGDIFDALKTSPAQIPYIPKAPKS